MHLDELTPCDGRDGHLLSASLRRRASLAILASAILALVIGLGQFAHFGVYAITVCLIFWITAGYSMSVEGDTIVVRRFGFTRRVRLSEITGVERYQYRNATSLRLIDRSGKRVSVSARVLGQDPVAAGHLRHWLDRPDVEWGLGAWALVTPDDGLSGATTTTSQSAGSAGSGGGPKGVLVRARPQSKWVRGMAIFSLVVFALGAIFMVVLVPTVWGDYFLSQRIQNGPEALATLHTEWVTSTSGRTGTQYTTHFDVSFLTRNGHEESTEVIASGLLQTLAPGRTLWVRYDPSNPTNAELPGHPNHSPSGALLVSGAALLVWLVAALMVRSVMKTRRLKRLARTQGSSRPQIVTGSPRNARSQGPGWRHAPDGTWYPPDPPPKSVYVPDQSPAYPFPSTSLPRTNGLPIALSVLGLVVAVIVAVVIGNGYSSRLQQQQLAISGAPGYSTFTGSAGLPLEEGQPWGRPCQPIVFAVDANVPAVQNSFVDQAILNARALGFDVTYIYPHDLWYPSVLYPPGQTNKTVQVIDISASTQWPSPLYRGHNEHIEFGWDTRVASGGNHEVLTYLQATLYLHAVTNDPQSTERAVRQLIAFSQGVGDSTVPGSSISFGNQETAFSKNDINAMQRMSGCTLQPTTTPGASL